MSGSSQVPDVFGRFGPYGGRYVPETLMRALEQLTAEYEKARDDESFHEELSSLFWHYVGRPSPLYHAERLSQEVGGAQIYLKREDLNHTGAHKINNTLGQALLTLRMGKKRVIAETGAARISSPQHPCNPAARFPSIHPPAVRRGPPASLVPGPARCRQPVWREAPPTAAGSPAPYGGARR